MVKETEYHEIGRIQLDTAIRLYEEENYICAITLAKASEEFLGKHLPKDESAFHRLKNSVEGKHKDIGAEINRVANFLKHGSDLSMCEQEIPVRTSAIQYITTAILNYLSFVGHLTPKMESFARYHTPEKVDLIVAESEKVA